MGVLNRRGGRPKAGFTLIELLVVLIVLGLAAAMVLPRMDSFSEQGSQNRARRMIGGAIARAQDLATLNRLPQAITFDLDNHTLTMSHDSKVVELPTVELAVTSPVTRKRITEGEYLLEISRYGTIEATVLEINRDALLVNPITGRLETYRP